MGKSQWMVVMDMLSSSVVKFVLNKCLFGATVLGFTPNYTSLNFRCLFKTKIQIKYIYHIAYERTSHPSNIKT